MSRFPEVARALMAVPTAPYREEWLIDALDDILRSLPGAEVASDRFGNRRVRIRRGEPSFAPVAFVAHTDHPGFVVESVSDDGRTVHATFEGGVGDAYFLGTPVRLFRSSGDAGIRGRVSEVSLRVGQPRGNRTITIEADADARGAVLAMWDLLPFETREGAIHSRACDDLAGVAMILEALRRVAESAGPADIIAVFTRAEETGFRGTLCLALAEDAQDWLPKDAWVISVETSSARPTTPIGGGAILRVGDRTSIFDPSITAALSDVSARAVEGGRRGLRRALMDGGSCEATAFVLYGWRSGGVCVPLGNYHNMDVANTRIAEEYVSMQDCEDLIEAMTSLAQGGIGGPSHADRLRTDFRAMMLSARDELIRTAKPFVR